MSERDSITQAATKSAEKDDYEARQALKVAQATVSSLQVGGADAKTSATSRFSPGVLIQQSNNALVQLFDLLRTVSQQHSLEYLIIPYHRHSI